MLLTIRLLVSSAEVSTQNRNSPKRRDWPGCELFNNLMVFPSAGPDGGGGSGPHLKITKI